MELWEQTYCDVWQPCRHCAESKLLPERMATGDRLRVGSQRGPTEKTWSVKTHWTKELLKRRRNQWRGLRRDGRPFATHLMSIRTLNFFGKKTFAVLKKTLSNSGSTTKGIHQVCWTPHGLVRERIAECGQCKISLEQKYHDDTKVPTKNPSNIARSFFRGTRILLKVAVFAIVIYLLWLELNWQIENC